MIILGLSMDQLAWFQTYAQIFFCMLQDKILVWVSAWEMRVNQHGVTCKGPVHGNLDGSVHVYHSRVCGSTYCTPLPLVDSLYIHLYLLVCLYLLPLGSPYITSLGYDNQSRTLTCTSTGGPATTVTWRRNEAVITLNATHQQTKRVVDPVAGTYQTVLTIDPSVSQSDIVGAYNCTVENARGRSSMTVIVGKLTLKYTSCCYPHYIGTWLLLCMR